MPRLSRVVAFSIVVAAADAAVADPPAPEKPKQAVIISFD
ncbi:MAG: polysaccharide deacetylase, partial [Mesorhizobium sp.]